MKKLMLLIFALNANFVGCTTTTTSNPNGSTTTVRQVDSKVIKAIANGAAQGATEAAIRAIQEHEQSN